MSDPTEQYDRQARWLLVLLVVGGLWLFSALGGSCSVSSPACEYGYDEWNHECY